MSEKAMNIGAKFYRAVSMCKNPPENGYNPHFNSKFSELEDILAFVRAACRECGIAYSQAVVSSNDRTYLHSHIIDEAGETMDLSVLQLPDTNDIQKLGSNITYARRYAALADFCIVGDVDADGEDGSIERPIPKPKSDSSKRTTYLKRIEELQDKATSMGIKPEGLMEYVNAKHGKLLAELDVSQLEDVGKHLAQIIADKEALDGLADEPSEG